LKQGATFLGGPGIVALEHSQQLRLHLVGGHLDRIRDQLPLRLQHLQIVGRDPLGNRLALFQQPLDLRLGLLELLAELGVGDLESPHRRSCRLLVGRSFFSQFAPKTRHLRPDMPVIVRTRDEGDLDRLLAAGATEVVPDTFESSLMLASHALVLLGVPLRRVLFFVGPLVETVSDFSPGDRAVVWPVRGHSMSTAICYEIVYPDLVRRFVVGGSELLTTITNDAWFGATSAPLQHFEQASMRAIETGRYLVRAANTGISGIVDPYGRVLARSEIYQSAVVVGDARFLQTMTLYTRIGDVFAYACVVMTAALLLLTRRRVRT